MSGMSERCLGTSACGLIGTSMAEMSTPLFPSVGVIVGAVGGAMVGSISGAIGGAIGGAIVGAISGARGGAIGGAMGGAIGRAMGGKGTFGTGCPRILCAM